MRTWPIVLSIITASGPLSSRVTPEIDWTGNGWTDLVWLHSSLDNDSG